MDDPNPASSSGRAPWKQPVLALAISYVLPIIMLPLVLHLLRRQRPAPDSVI